jgi:hypothetical protein
LIKENTVPNQPGYIANSRASRRVYRGLLRYADIYKIGVDPRWRESFPSFLLDMGRKPEGMMLRRRDESLGFYPSNCRWEPIPSPESSR